MANNNYSIKELFSFLEKVTGISSPKIKIPYIVALAGGYLIERLLRLPFSSFVLLNTDSVKAMSLKWYFDSSKSIRELGFPQTSIEKTIEKTVEWFKENGDIR